MKSAPQKVSLSAWPGAVLVCLLLWGPAAFGASEIESFLQRASGIPLSFEVNHGQADPAARFLARGYNYQFMISPAAADLFLCEVEGSAADSLFGRRDQGPSRNLLRRGVRLEFAGANPQAAAAGEEELPGKINYLLGDDPAQWHVGLATYAKVRVHELYPGIDLVYYGSQQKLEYDFQIAAHADPGAVELRFEGVDKLSINAQGELVWQFGNEEVRQPKPVLYQTLGGSRVEVTGGYRLRDSRSVSFTVGPYDHSRALIIDPVLSYCSYIGGNVGDNALALAMDAQGDVYIAGETLSTTFPTNYPPGSYMKQFQGGKINGDAFVAKFNNTASQLVYFTYLGGSGDDGAYSMTVDAAGNAYVAGFTDSTNFPVLNPIQITNHVCTTNITHNTTNIVCTTNIYVFGKITGTINTNTQIFPDDVFVAELNPAGTALIYSTYLGGSDVDVPGKIAVDAVGSAYVTGRTSSSNFPVVNAFQSGLGGNLQTNNPDIFLTKIAPGGRSLLYSTYLGGSQVEEGEGVAVFGTNLAYVSGYTASTNFPTTPNAIQRLLNNSTNRTTPYDVFVAKFDTSLSGTNSLLYCTLLGGTNSDVGTRIAVDSEGSAYVTGYTDSPDFPSTNQPPELTSGIKRTNVVFNSDAFLTKLSFDSNGAHIVYSSVFGGTNTDIGWDLAIQTNSGNAYVIGITASTNFPTFNTASFPAVTNFHPDKFSGSNDVFVTVFKADGGSLLYSMLLGGSRADYGYGIAVDPAGNAYIAGRTLSTNFPEVNPFSVPLQRTNNSFLAKISLEPRISVFSESNGGVAVQWPAFSPEFGLQTTTNLSAPVIWDPFAAAPAASNGWHIIVVDPTNPAAFFRLSR